MSGERQDTKLVTREELIKRQEDRCLLLVRDNAFSMMDAKSQSRCHYLDSDLLMRKWVPRQESTHHTWMANRQIGVPNTMRRYLIALTHDIHLAGHVWVKKTLALLSKHFYCPKSKELTKYFTIMGFPKEIQSDRESNFLSTNFQQTLYKAYC